MVFYKKIRPKNLIHNTVGMKTLKQVAMSDLNSPSPSELKSPRPTPVFFFEEQTFSSKKERPTPRERPPPTPRLRTVGASCPPISRLFSHRNFQAKARSVSFRESRSTLSSKYYDENSNKLYFEQCFELISKLGSGSFGEVFKVKSIEDGKCYAVKRSKERFKGKSDRKRKLEEVQKHEQLAAHQNCVQFFKAWEEQQYLYIQTELCKISLSQYSEKNHDIPESVIWNYLVDLLLAVKHLHDHNFVHLDIKPENIFVSEDGICKLGDFGLVLDLSKADTTDALEGDPKYLAPELMQGKFTKAADIFSLGITILELACDLYLPRGDKAWHQLREGEVPSQFLKRISSELSEVICRMMEPDYNKRPTVDDILQMTAVHKVYKRRKLQLKTKKMMSCIKLFCHWILFLLFWMKTHLMSCLYHFRKQKPEVTPPRDNDNSQTNWDYSFSDEVFDSNQSSDSVFGDSIEALKPMPLCFDDVSPEKERNYSLKFSENINRQALSTPAGLRYWDSKLQSCTTSPKLKGKRLSPCMSGSPVRRSPRLAAMDGKKQSSPTISPKNLMAVFNANSPD